MQSLQRSIFGRIGSAPLRWWPGIGRVGSAPPRWRPPALARREAPLMAAASAHPNQHLDRIPRLTFYAFRPWRVRNEMNQGNSDWSFHCSCATTGGMDDEEMTGATEEVNNDIHYMPILWDSGHRDGAIYSSRCRWEDMCIDIVDRTETRLEPMRLSVTKECSNDPDNCGYHLPCEMLQIFSLKLAETPINNSTIQLYGYIAARDEIDSMLNYVFHRGRDNPIIVQQGSLIEMTGPKRGIALFPGVLIEFDMRIKNGEHEDGDLQLIDGASELDELRMPCMPFHVRINGNCGAVDTSLTLVKSAVEAIVEVFIAEVQRGFDLSLSSVVSVQGLPQEFQFFHGNIVESCGLRRLVIAVELHTVMHLKFKVGQRGSKSNAEHHCSFQAKLHGYASHQIKLDLASISVKVTWATLFV